MRALITGINGFVGGHLAELLVRSGWNIWGVDRSGSVRLAHLQDYVQFQRVDLCNRGEVQQCISQIQPEVVFHLAGQAFVPESFNNPAATLATNVFAQLNIFLAMLEEGLSCRVLVVGSNEEYGLIQPEDIPVTEDTPLRPASPYGVSKVAQDMLALQYHLSHQIDVVRVRPFNHIGPRQTDRFVASSFAHQIARIEQGLQPPTLHVGDLRAQRDFTDVRDMVQAYKLAVEQGDSGQVYNLGSGQPVAIQSLLDILISYSNVDVHVKPEPSRMRPIAIPVVVCDASRFSLQTGWELERSLEQTLLDILEYWRGQVEQNHDAHRHGEKA